MAGIALNRCVPTVAPASIAASAPVRSVSVCPTAAITPAPAIVAIASSAPARSGAKVIMRMTPAPAASSRRSSAGSGSRSSAGSWAPQRCSDSHGPSRWTPAIRPSATSSLSIATPASRSAGAAVTRLASVVVVPWARWCSTARRADSPSRSVNDPPPPPCTWMSTNPGTTSCAPRSSSGSRGGRPVPTSTISSPSIASQPGAARSGVTTVPALMIRTRGSRTLGVTASP